MITNNKREITLSEVQNLIEQIAANSKKIINNDFDKFLHDCDAAATFDLHTCENITCEDMLQLNFTFEHRNCKVLLILADIPNIGELPARDFWEFAERVQSHYICDHNPLLAAYDPKSTTGTLHLIAQH